MTIMISTKALTKDYGLGKGIFNLDLEVTKGEVVGLVGTNGAGKITTLRLLMGFLKPSRGRASINSQDTWKKSANLKRIIGYVPGEIAFPDTKSGQTFLKMQLDMLHLKAKQNARVNDLIQKLKIDTTASIKRMSKGMKQKVALVCAFMSDPEVLLLDEPTTGLDPVMRDVFIDLVREAKQKGTTIIMSSHMFNELEPTCDRIVFLKDGQVLKIIDAEAKEKLKEFQKIDISVDNQEDFHYLEKTPFTVHQLDTKNKVVSFISHRDEFLEIINALEDIIVSNISITDFGLDHYFTSELGNTYLD